jgi:hypothetical protein
MILILGAIIIATVIFLGWTDLRSGLRLLEKYDEHGPSGLSRPPANPPTRGNHGTRPREQQ